MPRGRPEAPRACVMYLSVCSYESFGTASELAAGRKENVSDVAVNSYLNFRGVLGNLTTGRSDILFVFFFFKKACLGTRD